MASFDRMVTSWFKPKKEPTRTPRVAIKTPVLSDTRKPTVDERTAFAAKEILENQSFDRVFNRLRTGALADFSDSAEGEEGAYFRDKAHVKLTVLDEIRSEIETMAEELKLHTRKSDDN